MMWTMIRHFSVFWSMFTFLHVVYGVSCLLCAICQLKLSCLLSVTEETDSPKLGHEDHWLYTTSQS